MSIFIVYFLPSDFGLKLFINFNKERKLFDSILYYLLFVLFSNFIAMTILTLISEGEFNWLNHSATSFDFCVKYMAFTMLLNVILSILFTIISKYFNIEIEVQNGRKEKTKKNIKDN